MVGAVCPDLLGAVCPDLVGAVWSGQVGSIKAKFPLGSSITKKILSIQSLNEEDKSIVFKTIDALLRDANVRKVYAK